MELIPGQKKQRTCIIATNTPESFGTHGFDMLNHKSQHWRHGRRAKITSGQTCLSVRAGTPLIHMELQGPDPRPNSMQDGTPTPLMLSRTTTTKRPTPSSPVPTTPSLTSEYASRTWTTPRTTTKVEPEPRHCSTRTKSRHHDNERQHHHHDAILEHWVRPTTTSSLREFLPVLSSKFLFALLIYSFLF